MNDSENSIGIFTTDTNLMVRSWDSWMARATGISVETARGQSLARLLPDIEERGHLARFERVLKDGVVETLAPAFHRYLIPCAPLAPSKYFDKMEQRVTIAPLREQDLVVGTIVTIEDVTARRERERNLSEQMKSSDEMERLDAAIRLSTEKNPESVKPLHNALGDESWRVRRVATEGVAQRKEPEAIESLIRVLRDEHQNPSLLNSALQVLTLSGVDVVESLIEFVNDKDADLRIYSVLALGDQPDSRSIPALIGALEDENANVRYHAIEALGKLRAVESVDALAAIAESQDFFLAFPAIDALRNIGEASVAPRLVPLLEKDLLSAAAAEALGQLGDEEMVVPLVALLNNSDAPTATIAGALAALHDRYEKQFSEGDFIADIARNNVNETGVQNLIESLDRASADELRALAQVLGWLEGEAAQSALTRLISQPSARKEVVKAMVRHGERVTDLLIAQLDNESIDVRQAAIIALGRIGSPRATPALIKALIADADLVITAAGALAKIGDRQAFDALIGLIGHPNAAARQAVVGALNSLGHPEMAARVATLLNDPDPRVRESAVRIAGYFGYEECIELIFQRCHDENENVRRASIEHLPFIEDERIVDTLVAALKNETARVRASAAHAFAQVDLDQSIPHLFDAIKDEDPWVRYNAIRSIGRHRHAEAFDVLSQLASADPASHVRIAAIDVLGEIGGERAVETLVPLIESDDRDVERAALGALGSIDQPEALEPLLAAARSQDSARRISAVIALGTRGGSRAVETLQWVAAADTDTEVADAAIGALSQIATPEAVTAIVALTADPSRREACIDALAHQREDKIDLIGRGLNHANEAVRRAVVDALARMRHPRASELLRTALKDKDQSVRLAAAAILRRYAFGHKQLTANHSTASDKDSD